MGAIEQEHKGRSQSKHACGATCNPPSEMRACSFPPEQLEAALDANANYGFDSRFKYTELIVDAEQMKKSLPGSLLGIFYMDDDTKAHAINIHERFLNAFKISRSEFALMYLSLDEGFSEG